MSGMDAHLTVKVPSILFMVWAIIVPIFSLMRSPLIIVPLGTYVSKLCCLINTLQFAPPCCLIENTYLPIIILELHWMNIVNVS